MVHRPQSVIQFAGKAEYKVKAHKVTSFGKVSGFAAIEHHSGKVSFHFNTLLPCKFTTQSRKKSSVFQNFFDLTHKNADELRQRQFLSQVSSVSFRLLLSRKLIFMIFVILLQRNRRVLQRRAFRKFLY